MTQALRAAATNGATATTKDKPQTIATMLSDPKFKAQMALALPRHMTADRMARVVLTEIRKVPQLASCDQGSFLGSLMTCAQLGLEPGSALGHAYLLPYRNNRKGITECQLIIGYRGMIDLARRSGQMLSVEARAVFEADKFEVQLGLNPNLVHVPAWEAAERGPLRFVYAVAKLKDGGTQFEVMSRLEVDKVRAQSKSSGTGPWSTNYEEMAKKTVIRRLFKYLPVSIELARAVELDERDELGKGPDTTWTIDGESFDVGSDDAGDDHGHDDTREAITHDTPPAAALESFIARLQTVKDDLDLDVLSQEAREALSNGALKAFTTAAAAVAARLREDTE